MQIKMKCNIELDENSYFLIEWTGSNYRLTLTNSTRHPIHISNIKPIQLHGLMMQAETARQWRDSEAIQKDMIVKRQPSEETPKDELQ